MRLFKENKIIYHERYTELWHDSIDIDKILWKSILNK